MKKAAVMLYPLFSMQEISCTTELFKFDKSYYMGLYFLYFNRHNIRKFVNILPVIFGR